MNIMIRLAIQCQASDFPLELLYLRDDDIPGVVADGSADMGIVGLNEVEESGVDVEIACHLGFGKCRLSLAVPKSVEYEGLEWFEGKRHLRPDKEDHGIG